MNRPLGLIAVLALACLSFSCRHDWSKAEEFAASVRCGMTEAEVRRLATELGAGEEQIWRQHDASNILTVRPRQLDFIDVLLQGGEAVAVQRGNYIAFTTGMEFGPVRMLCGASPIASDLRDFDSGQ